MKYPILTEFEAYSKFQMPTKPFVLKLANVLMPMIQKGKKLDERLVIETIKFSGCSAQLIQPKEKDAKSVLVYLHGGAFAMKAAAYHKNLAQVYALAAGCAVLFVDYRLAPKYKFPVPVEDCLASYEWACNQSQFEKIMVGGDSAGGNLALAITRLAIKQGLRKTEKLMLVYPVTDSRMCTKSMKTYVDTPLWNAVSNAKMWELYVDEAQRHDVLVSPIEADDFAEFPPTYVETAEYDCLHDEGLELADKLIQAGISVVVNETKNTMHGYDIAEDSAYVKEQVGKRVEFLK